MIIISNDKKIIANLYEKLENNNENVQLHRVTVEGAYGFDEFLEWLPKVDIKVDVKVDFSEIIVTWINRYFDYKTQMLMLKKSETETVVIDTTVMNQGKPLEQLNIEINENDTLYIETIKEEK